jgi:hypothetical protein
MKSRDTAPDQPASGQPGAPRDIEADLRTREILDLEDQVRRALRSEADEAVAKIESGDATHLSARGSMPAPEEPGEIDSNAFTESLRRTWQRESLETIAESSAMELSAKAEGLTARLPRPAASSQVTPLHRIIGPWSAAAAAAVILVAALGWMRLSGDSKATDDALGGAATTEAIYLGADESSSGSSQEHLTGTPGSTGPGILPETVHFSVNGPQSGTFRLEVYDVAQTPRIDDLSGLAFQTTIYKPEWTCSEIERANLPNVFRLEVYRSVDPPGARPLYTELFTRR